MRNTSIILLLLCMTLIVLLLTQEEKEITKSTYSVSDVMRGGDAEGFKKVLQPREFLFPRDHGKHSDYRTEWWYFTGNLVDENGRDFGYQLTFFRLGLDKEVVKGNSFWHSNAVYMAHFALTDISANKFHAFERFSRGAAGLAGAAEKHLDVWLDDWSIRSTGEEEFPLRLSAFEKGISLELEIDRGKAVVLQGDAGLSQKNRIPGNASYYYSFTRMPSTGRVTIFEKEFEVSGLSWMDREWSSSALDQNQIGWDWFSLQLDNNSELMLYRFRQKDGSRDPFSYGIYVPENGAPVKLGSDDFQISTRSTWRSSTSETLYPVAWSIDVPQLDISLDVDAAIENQEWNLSFRYWEGAVTIAGNSEGTRVKGLGYVEMTGYSETTNNKGGRF